MPEKLTLNDITLLTAGEQIKKALYAHYGCPETANVRQKAKCIEKFAEEIGRYLRTIKIYLSGSDYHVGSAYMREKIVEVIGKGYDEIALTEQKQIERYVDSIAENIKLYDQESDVEVIEKVLDMCKDRHMEVAVGKMLRAKGMHYFYRTSKQDINAAIELLNIAIDRMDKYMEKALAISYMIESELLYLAATMHAKGKEVFNKIERRLTDCTIDNQTLFLHYYRAGIMRINAEEYISSIPLFEKAFRFAEADFFKGKAIMNKGVALKKMERYDEAIAMYEKALNYFPQDNKKDRCIILNNIAEAYKCKGDLKQAYNFVVQAMSVKEYSSRDYLVSVHTYAEIMALKGQTTEVLYELLDLIYQSKIYRQFVVEALGTIIHYGKNDLELMEKTKELIINEINSLDREREQEYLHTLKITLADITIIINNIFGRRCS